MDNSFKPSSEMIFATVQSDCERLLKHCRGSKSKLLKLDLSEVTQCDSAGLALLIEAKRLCTKQKRTYKIEGMQEAVYALAEFCGVDKILELSR